MVNQSDNIERGDIMLTKLPQPVAAFFHTANASDPDAFIANFTDNAILIDGAREYSGIIKIKEWSKTDLFAANVKYEVTNAAQHNQETIVTAKVDGNFDKTGLPDPLMLDHHFIIAEGKISRLTVQISKAS
jgi:hypothetical protein